MNYAIVSIHIFLIIYINWGSHCACDISWTSYIFTIFYFGEFVSILVQRTSVSKCWLWKCQKSYTLLTLCLYLCTCKISGFISAILCMYLSTTKKTVTWVVKTPFAYTVILYLYQCSLTYAIHFNFLMELHLLALWVVEVSCFIQLYSVFLWEALELTHVD